MGSLFNCIFGYQVSYIRLLSKFVDASYDCNGVKDGTAYYDACGQCAGGDTGIDPVTDPNECSETVTGGLEDEVNDGFSINPNPGEDQVFIESKEDKSIIIRITDVTGKSFFENQVSTNDFLSIKDLPGGTYFIVIEDMDS